MIHLCKHHILATALLLIATQPALADFCPNVPNKAWPSGAPEYRCSILPVPCTPSTVANDCYSNESCVLYGTFDDQHISHWCSPFQSLWYGLHIDADDWDEGHGAVDNGGGWHPTCSPNDFLTRLFNGGHLVQSVTNYAIPYGLHRILDDPDSDLSSADVTGNDRFRGNWWNFVASHEPDEWVPGCNNFDTLATNHEGVDDYIELHRLSAYRNTVLDRSSTIVHETVHEDVSHLDDTACTAGGSCDIRYGRYNAQTMQIDYLYDAATMYQTQMLNNQLVRIATYYTDPNDGVRMCEYIPAFSDYERNRALSKANTKYNENFWGSPMIPMIKFDDADQTDLFKNPEWECDLCQVSQWNFQPDQCEQTACNELLNANNEAVNNHNWLECHAYNVDVITGGYSQEAITQAKADHPYQNCQVSEKNAAIAFCESEKATATHVNEVDSCGWLEGFYEPGFSRTICIQEFCHERFEADQGVGWSPSGDPYGCLDAICAPDGESCNDDLPEAQCKQLFVAAHGHPDYYAASCTINGCKRARASCLADNLLQDPNAWEYPQPVPSQCKLIYDICKHGEQLSTLVFMSLKELILGEIGTGPVEQTINPAFFLQDIVIEYQTMMNSGAGSDELQGLMDAMLSEPEMLMGLFQLAPERFVALFGTEGFEEFIGPSIHQVTPRPITPGDLSPQGQQALVQLETLIQETPELYSPFGTLRSQQGQIGSAVCGDLDFSGALDPADIGLLRDHLTGFAPLRPEALERCTVIGAAPECNVRQVAALKREIEAPGIGVGVAQVCAAARPEAP